MSNATELLRRAKNNLHGAKLCSVNSMSSRGEMLRLMDEAIKGIDEFLAAEPEADEPVAWEVTFNRGTGTDKLIVRTRDRAEREVKSSLIISVEPLYFHPPRPEPARKPMTEEEIDEEIATNEHYCERSFAEGVRWAEQHHGISSSIPSLNDTISADSRDSGHE